MYKRQLQRHFIPGRIRIYSLKVTVSHIKRWCCSITGWTWLAGWLFNQWGEWVWTGQGQSLCIQHQLHYTKHMKLWIPVGQPFLFQEHMGLVRITWIPAVTEDHVHACSATIFFSGTRGQAKWSRGCSASSFISGTWMVLLRLLTGKSFLVSAQTWEKLQTVRTWFADISPKSVDIYWKYAILKKFLPTHDTKGLIYSRKWINLKVITWMRMI